MTKKQYRVVSESTMDELERKIEYFLNNGEGWVPQGGVSTMLRTHPSMLPFRYAQAILREYHLSEQETLT